MIEIAAIFASILLAVLAIFQALLVVGLPLGNFAWGGAHKVLPIGLRIGSAVSICMYALFVLIILEESELTSIIVSNSISNVGIWVVTTYFFLGIGMNAISRSRRERLVMTPIVSLLALLFLFVALRT